MTDDQPLTIPLRRHYRIYPRWKRTKIAIRATRNYLQHHLKTNNIKIGKYLNLHLHTKGRKHPPHHVQVTITKDNEYYIAELINAPVETTTTKETKKKLEEKITTPEKIQETTQEPPPETEKEKLEEQKKQTLKTEPPHKHTEEKLETEKKAKDLKAKESPGLKKLERLKKQYPKTQKPSHEKRLSKK